ncbi:MFS transporter [Leucobacter sp. M11]|uniref:MFS transporter n=1 Tax=Leucobacter sp. M11 TaxID=2993565 RepID=UPI002D7F0D88|nr:MFS transporter [Leucobacter sp. M11]MEB4614243.1 MFS transporter [Leucobacter sp. M11]
MNQTHANPEAVRRSRRAATASAVGSLVEWYDFALYGAAAALVFNTYFFVNEDPATGLMYSFATFAVGYFARPLGGILFGHLGDKIGRKPVMIACLLLMGISTALIGLLPSYESIGLTAPVLLVALRVLQGLGAGAEYAGAIILSSESSIPARRGFYASWSGAGVWIGSALGLLMMQLMVFLTGDNFTTWGWRIPFLFSLVMLGVSMYIRRRVSETEQFKQAESEDKIVRVPLFTLMRTEKRRLLVALGSNFMLSGFSYIPQVWALSYLTNNLGFAAALGLGINATILLAGSIFMPVFGRLGDRIGRRKLFLFGAAFGALWAVPMFLLIDTKNPVLTTLALAVCFVGAVATCYAAQAAFLAELFPPALRYSGVAFAREVSGAILGGTAPLIATSLIVLTGHWFAIAAFMIANATVAFIAVYFSKYFRSDRDQGDEERFTEDTTGTLRVIGSAQVAERVSA